LNNNSGAFYLKFPPVLTGIYLTKTPRAIPEGVAEKLLLNFTKKTKLSGLA